MRKYPHTRHKQAGFSMFELAVVLTIAGLIGGSVLSATASRVEVSRLKETKKRMAVIVEAIEDYIGPSAGNNVRLPCPADPRLRYDDFDFGFEADITEDCQGMDVGDIAVPPNMVYNNMGTDEVVGGGVPIRTLHIAPEYAIDGFGRKFTYVVDLLMTQSGMGFYEDQKGRIIIKNDTMGIEITDKAAYVLLSHGVNGHGAWHPKGDVAMMGMAGRIDKGGATVNVNEQENSYNGDGVAGQTVGTAFDNVFIQKFEVPDFDDLIEYRLRWQLPDP